MSLFTTNELHKISAITKILFGTNTLHPPYTTKYFVCFKLFCKKHDDYRCVLIEAKANGEAIIDSVKNEVKNVIPINPTESKEERAEAVAPMFQANRIFLPHPSIAPWINDCINELKTFPNGRNDDFTDSTTQYLNYMRENKVGSFGGMSKNNASSSFKNAEKRLSFRN